MSAVFRPRHNRATDAMIDKIAEDHPLLSHTETMRLIRKAQKGGVGAKRARDKVVLHNMRLVAKWAAYYDRKLHLEHLRFEDLVQEGVPGVIRAIEKFDPDSGYKFSTYATPWIRQMIRRATHDRDRIMRLPVHVSEAGSRLWGLKQTLLADLGREPTDEEVRVAAIAKWGQKAEKAIDRFHGKALPAHTYSLDVPVSREDRGGEGATFSDILVDEGAEAEFLAFVDPERLEWAMSRLSERARSVIEMRYGTNEPNKPRATRPNELRSSYAMTLDEVGEYYGVSRERVRQIQRKAILRLAALLGSENKFKTTEDRLEAAGWNERLRFGALREARERQGMTVWLVAERAGLSEDAVKRADLFTPSTRTFVKLCKALEVQPEDMLGAEPDEPEQTPLFCDGEEAV